MTRLVARCVALAAVVTSALVAYAAVGTGEIAATAPVTVVTVTSTTGSGSGTVTLENTTSATSFSVAIDADATCDPEVTFDVAGGNPIASFGAGTTRNVTIGCPPRGSAAMHRCLFHATNSANGTLLGDFMGACLYGASPPSLTPLQTSLDFGSIAVGNFAEQTLTIRNDGSGAPIRRVYLMASDVAGNFELTTPCNPDGAYCDIDLASEVAPGGTFEIGVKCRPQAEGTHSAELYVGTDTFQLLSLGVTLQCQGTATTLPALALTPTTIEIPAPVEVAMGSAATTVHVANAGGGTLLIEDVRIVDLDTGAAEDWSYSASGDCTGQITSVCSLEAGEQVDLAITFDPTAIGNRRAALLVTYRDTLDRTTVVPLEGVGLGARLRRLGPQTPITFGMVPVGRSSQLDITLVNEGNRDTMATVTLDASTTPPFSILSGSPTVSPGTPSTVTLECAPTSAGPFMSTVTIATPDAMQPITINATCEGTTVPIHAAPTALAFGEVRLGVPATVTVQLASTNGVVTLAGQPTLETAEPTVTLGALSQLTTPASFTVTVAPQATGSISTSVLVTTTDDQVLRIPLTATGVEAAYIAADTLDLGTFCVGQPTTSSNLTLLSTGTATIELMPPSLGKSPSPFELSYTSPAVYPHMLSGGRSAVVSVTPQRQRTAIPVEDTLTWRTDVAAMTTITTNVTARFIDSGFAIAPPALDFGEVTVHLFTDNGQRVVIQNCNPTPLTLDPPNIRTPFSIDSPSFPAMLSPNESVAFSIGFHPTRKGPVTDTLRITSPQLPGQTLEVVLVGVGGPTETMPDAGPGAIPPGDPGCSCSSTRRPLGLVPFALALLVVLFPRRRSGLR